MSIYNREVETMPREELEQLQIERLQSILNRVFRHVAFYQQRFGSCGLEPGDLCRLESLAELPFTTKADLREAYPYDMFAVPLRDVVRIHSTSGTTGTPIGVGYTINDVRNWSRLTARVLVAAGVGEHDLVQIAFPNLSTGLFGFHYGAERLGAGVVPASQPDIHEQIRIMRDYKTTALVSTPGYALHIAAALEEMKIHPQQLNLKCALLGGHPWSEALRQEIEDRLQLEAFDNYGLSEILGPGISGECSEHNGLHINEDHFLVEVVDVKTLRPLPPGEEGELVFTSLSKEAFPLIRYRTGDLGALLPGECGCGRTLARMSRVAGRCDDLVIIGSLKFFPDRVAEILRQCHGMGPRAELIIDGRVGEEQVTLHAELAEKGLQLDRMKELQALKQHCRRLLEEGLGLMAEVSLVETGALPAVSGKRSIVITDRRKN